MGYDSDLQCVDGKYQKYQKLVVFVLPCWEAFSGILLKVKSQYEGVVGFMSSMMVDLKSQGREIRKGFSRVVGCFALFRNHHFVVQRYAFPDHDIHNYQ